MPTRTYTNIRNINKNKRGNDITYTMRAKTILL